VQAFALVFLTVPLRYERGYHSMCIARARETDLPARRAGQESQRLEHSTGDHGRSRLVR
jgi:hypothetical protein